MAGNVLTFRNMISEDQLGCRIADMHREWNMLRQNVLNNWEEIARYVYATDTTQTTNSKLPWKNTTTLPKICQITDNLIANYMAALFPKKNWLEWEPGDQSGEGKEKADAIKNYMGFVIEQPDFKPEVQKLITDYVLKGNAFVMAEWDDASHITSDGRTQVGFVGPRAKRISPHDIVFNPIADSFDKSPKIIRSLVSMGEVKDIIDRESTVENKEAYDNLWTYLVELRQAARNYPSEYWKDVQFTVDGFSNYQQYLGSDIVELLTFYGDIYDVEKNEFHKNVTIVVVDQHKIIYNKPNPSFFGRAPIFHMGWRIRPDNLWAMGPLENLIGLQYRLDHVENLKSDVLDLIAYPVLKIKGVVEDFEWEPLARIHVDVDSDVELLAPPFQVLQMNTELISIEARMEEMAGAPKEALGIRTPGEKTAYEVQRLENAASRIFQHKIMQFEEGLEKLMNAMLELGRRLMSSAEVRVFDDEFKFNTFIQLTPTDITGAGRIKPMGARHFAEKAEIVQNLNNFFASAIGADPDIKAHYSSIKLATMFEDLLGVQDYELVTPYVRLTEQSDAKRIAQADQEQVAMEADTSAGIAEDDFDLPMQGEQQ